MTLRSVCLLWVAVAVLAPAGCGSRSAGGAASGEASERRKKALGQQDWAAAAELSGEAIQLEPKNADGWWIRGLARLKLKEYPKAVEDCTEAIKLDGNYAAPYRERGLAYHYQGKYPQAIEDLTAFIRLRPVDAEGYQFRALAYLRSGNQAAAAADLAQADKLKKK